MSITSSPAYYINGFVVGHGTHDIMVSGHNCIRDIRPPWHGPGVFNAGGHGWKHIVPNILGDMTVDRPMGDKQALFQSLLKGHHIINAIAGEQQALFQQSLQCLRP